MTDDLRPKDPLEIELERIARQVPALPPDFSELRALQALIPPPFATEQNLARAEDIQGPAGGALGLPSIVGGSPSSQPGASVGTLAELFYGKSNLLRDPMFYAPGLSNPIPITTPAPTNQAEWEAWYTKASGTAPTGRSWQSGLLAEDASNVSNSRVAEILTGGYAGASDVTYFVEQKGGTAVAAGAPFLVAAVRLIPFLPTLTGVTTWTIQMEIVNSSGTTLAASSVVDLIAFSTTAASRRLAAALAAPNGTYWWRIRMRVVTSAGTSGSTNPGIAFAEPQLTLAQSQQPPPFSPIVGGWAPNHLRYVDDPLFTDNVIDVFGINDTVARFQISPLGVISWGPGTSATDVNLYRTGGGFGSAILTTDYDFKTFKAVIGVDGAFTGKLQVGRGVGGGGLFVQAGSVTVAMGGAAVATQAVSFSPTFDNVPWVFVTRRSTTGAAPKVHMFLNGSPTASGFTAGAATGDGTTSAASVVADWFAIDTTHLF